MSYAADKATRYLDNHGGRTPEAGFAILSLISEVIEDCAAIADADGLEYCARRIRALATPTTTGEP